MSNAATCTANKIWGGYPAEPVLIRCGGADRPEIRVLVRSIQCQQVEQLGAAGGSQGSPAQMADFCGFQPVRMALVASACRSTGKGMAEFCGFRPDVPLMNNQRTSGAAGRIGRAGGLGSGPLAARRGVSPLSDRAPAPHAGRARVTSDFRDIEATNRPIAACTTGAPLSAGAEPVNSRLGSGVRGRTDARNLARKTRANRPSGRSMAVGFRVSVHCAFDPVPVAEAAPRRG